MNEYTRAWLTRKNMYRDLKQIAKIWSQDNEENSKLSLILYEVWSAVQRIASYPHVCVLHRDGLPVGVLCGHPWSPQRTFFIQHIAIQSLNDGGDMMHEVHRLLVEAAIDCSQEYGFHGWVSHSPVEEDVTRWRSLGFSKDPVSSTMHRMGYFTQ